LAKRAMSFWCFPKKEKIIWLYLRVFRSSRLQVEPNMLHG